MKKLNIEQIKIIEKKNNVVIDEDTMMYVGPNDPCWKKIPSEWLFCDCCGTQVISDDPEIAEQGLRDRCNREINDKEIEMKKLNRDQAIEIAGIDAIEAVEHINCEHTNRLTDGTEWHGYDEFSAYYQIDDNASIKAFYYQCSEDVAAVENLDELDWEIEFYIFDETK